MMFFARMKIFRKSTWGQVHVNGRQYNENHRLIATEYREFTKLTKCLCQLMSI